LLREPKLEDLRRFVKEPLTGRKREFLLYPVSLAELGAVHEFVALRDMLPRLLRFGSYPEAITSHDADQIVRAIAEDYLFRDILELENLKSVALLRALLEALALQLGNEVSTNELAGLVGISRETVERYLDLLERSFVVFRVRALSRNPRKEIAKSRKVYFYDLGIRNALTNNFNELHLRNVVGVPWENFCVNERLKRNHYAGRLVNTWFWRTYDQKKLDWVEEGGGALAGFEFKWGGRASTGREGFRGPLSWQHGRSDRPGAGMGFCGRAGERRDSSGTIRRLEMNKDTRQRRRRDMDSNRTIESRGSHRS
jgi:uncharacterized protein